MGENRTPDFSGWATKNDIVCADGKTIKSGAFAHMDKAKVPLVWMHNHKDNEMVLGHVILEHKAEGTWAEAFFNDTTKGIAAHKQVANGDIDKMSIWANDLDMRGDNVFHGQIREVSLVLAGANPGAEIENIYIRHGDDVTELDEAIIRTGLPIISHATAVAEAPAKTEEETVKDIFDAQPEKVKNVVVSMVNNAFEAGMEAGASKATVEHSAIDADENQTVEPTEPIVDEVTDTNTTDGDQNVEPSAPVEVVATDSDNTDATVEITHSSMEGTNVTDHNAFESNATTAVKTPVKPVLSHDAMKTIMADAIQMNSLPEAIVKHAGTYGIDDIEFLFPDARNLDSSPQLLARQVEWVPKVLDAVKRQPFAKVKSIVADLTAEEARAKGYIKGNEKKDEVISLLRRTTSPTTIYKKQRLDRDDIIDITDFDVITWIKWEIRFMLNEELARAILIGDGRATNHDDKIKDPAGAVDGIGIRSILNDSSLYVYKKELVANVSNIKIIEEFIRARSQYRGSGSPTLYTTDAVVTDLLLLVDKMGRFLYETDAALAARLRVKEIVAVEALEQVPTVLGIVVNLIDYSIGTNKGGELTFFEDFDLDFNQNKYLLETRLSGALTRPKSAIVLTRAQGTAATPTGPSFNGTTNTITIPNITGLDYRIDGDVVSGDVVITEDTEVTATPETGYYIPSNSTTSWTFTP